MRHPYLLCGDRSLEPVRCVERGGMLLDLEVYGWWRKVDPSSLDLANPDDCVLGQIYRGIIVNVKGLSTYSFAVKRLGLSTLAQLLCGFEAVSPHGYEALNEAWRNALVPYAELLRA
jgi:hypothetical protein